MAEEAKWYVAHTYSGYENKVMANIEKSVENRGMQDLILDVKELSFEYIYYTTHTIISQAFF